MKPHQYFKKNITKRLKQLKVSPYKVSVEADKRPGWLGQILNRSTSKVSLDIVEQVAEALNLPAWALIYPSFVPSDYVAPAWVLDDEEIGAITW